jgi:hypothetical protein
VVKGIEKSFLTVIEAEVNQIAICVEGIRTFLKLAIDEADKLEEDADEKG